MFKHDIHPSMNKFMLHTTKLNYTIAILKLCEAILKFF